MSTLTTLWALIKPAGTDLVRDGDDTARTLADRLDYLQGEQGNFSFAATAGVQQTTTVNLTRAYPNGFLVAVWLRSAVTSSSASAFCWATGESGTGGPGGVGTFTLGCSTSTATSRNVGWKVIPLP